MENGWTKRIEELEAEMTKPTGDLPPMQLTDNERRDGHSALRWNKGKQAIETFDPHPSVGLTDDDRKMLTEYLGECWHKVKAPDSKLSKATWPTCELCNTPGWDCYRRPFTTPADLHAVYSAMMRKGEWAGFIEKTYEDWATEVYGPQAGEFIAWLFCLACPEQIPERMKLVCTLIGRQ